VTPDPHSPTSPNEADLRIKSPKDSAAGLPAVAVTLRRTVSEMGLVRTLRTLSRINQVDGFDCPGCAWPEPDPGKRKHIEFCENGVKAVTWEATAKRTTPAFFATHTVSELWNWSDFELENEGRLTDPMAYDRSYQLPGAGLSCFFRDDELSDLIGFSYATWRGDDAAANLVEDQGSEMAAAAQPGHRPAVPPPGQRAPPVAVAARARRGRSWATRFDSRSAGRRCALIPRQASPRHARPRGAATTRSRAAAPRCRFRWSPPSCLGSRRRIARDRGCAPRWTCPARTPWLLR